MAMASHVQHMTQHVVAGVRLRQPRLGQQSHRERDVQTDRQTDKQNNDFSKYVSKQNIYRASSITSEWEALEFTAGGTERCLEKVCFKVKCTPTM